MRSEFGSGLFDSGDPREARAASALLKEASAGLAGAGAPEALAAEYRLAGRLARFCGHGRAPWLGIPYAGPGELAGALDLFRESASFAPPGPEGAAARLSNRSGATAVLII